MNTRIDFENRRDALIEAIVNVFDQVSRADGITLYEAAAIDDRLSAADQRKAREQDVETRWQDVSEEDILGCCSALGFLDSKGFRYYLPAFMRVALQKFYDNPNGIRSSCAYNLTRLPSKSLRKSEPCEIASKYQFSSSEIIVISKFLRFCIDFDDIVSEPAFVDAVKKWERLASSFY